MDAFWDKDDDKEVSGSNESNTASDIDASGTKKRKTNNSSSKKDSVTADDVWEDPISCAVQDNELFQFGATPLDQRSCYSLTLESVAHLIDTANSGNSNSPTTLVCILDGFVHSESETHSSQRNTQSLPNTKTNSADVNFSKAMSKNGKMPTIPRPSHMTALQKPSAIFKTCEMSEITLHETMRSPANDQAATTNPKSKQSIWKQFPAEKDSVHHRGMQSTAQRFMQRFESFRLAKFIQEATILARDDSMKGKLVMVLMSTVCSVIVGMIGALLFVVALKIRILQSRRQPEGIPPRHQTGVPPQIRESGYKRVIPRRILDSFGVRTVLRTSTTAMVTTAVTKSNLVGFSKATKLCYAGDVNEMEEGMEDMFTRRDVRRQQQQTRTSHLFTHARALQGQDEVAAEQDFLDDEGDNGAGWGIMLEDEAEEMAANDLQRITAAIMNATRRGSYRRVSHSRQGQGQGQGQLDSSMISGALLSMSTGSQLRECEEEKQRMCGCGDGESHEEEKEKLPFANANAQTMCSICLSEYEVGDQVRTLPCYHQYHTSCIDPWLLTVASLCPICKRDLLPVSAA
ncbi:hypothetical protein BGZ79_007426 [Entomortierella chlamydospora]|nr:hypothetical protein BGZ79_007426 [Entomortierella chlamydospora]